MKISLKCSNVKCSNTVNKYTFYNPYTVQNIMNSEKTFFMKTK